MTEADSESILMTRWARLPLFVWLIIALVLFVVLLGACLMLGWRRRATVKRSVSEHLAMDDPAELEFWVQADRRDGEEWGMLTEACPQGLRITAIEEDGILAKWNKSHRGLAWKVTDANDVSVYQRDNARSKVLRKIPAGSIVFGVCHQEWVELENSGGYVAKLARGGAQRLERLLDVSIMVGDVIVKIDGFLGAEAIQKEMCRRKVERFFVRRLLVEAPDAPPPPPKPPEAVIDVAVIEVFAISDTDATAMPLELGSTSRWSRAAVPAHQLDLVREVCRLALEESPAALPPKVHKIMEAKIMEAAVAKRVGGEGCAPGSFGACCVSPREGGLEQIQIEM